MIQEKFIKEILSTIKNDLCEDPQFLQKMLKKISS